MKGPVLFAACALGLGVSVSHAQPRVIEFLALDFNQDGETRVFKEMTKACPNIRVRTPLDPAENRKGSPKERILKLCESGYRPDIVQFSGHYASAWSGDETRGRLTMNELEELSCDPKCKSFFESSRVEFFHSCNGLLGSPKRNESMADYLKRLLSLHGNHFSSDSILAAGVDMYQSADGLTNAARLNGVFPNHAAMLGFSGGAPLASKDNGKSEQGFKSALQRFAEQSGKADLCGAIESLLDASDPAENSALMGKLVEAWKKSLNEVDARGQDAAAICPGCVSHSGADAAKAARVPAEEDMPRELYCLLSCGDPGLQLKSVKEAIAKPAWLSKYFQKLVFALEGVCAKVEPGKCAERFSEAEREALLEQARLRLGIADMLVYKWEPYRVIELLSSDAKSGAELKRKLSADLVKAVAAIVRDPLSIGDRDLFRETLLRSPASVFKASVAQDPVVFEKLYVHMVDPQLKYDIKRLALERVGALNRTILLNQPAFNAEIYPDGKHVSVVDGGIRIRVFEETPGGFIERNSDLSEQPLVAFTATEDGASIAFQDQEGRIQVSSKEESGANARAETRLTEASRLLILSKDGSRLSAVSEKGILRAFEAVGAELKETGSTPLLDGVNLASVSAQRDRLVVSNFKGLFRVFDLSDPERPKRIGEKQMSDSVTSVQFSPDAKQVLVATAAGELSVFEPVEGELKPVLSKKYDHRITSARYFPDGKRIVVSGFDQHLRVLQVAPEGFKELGALKLPEDVFGARVSADGREILASYGNDYARFYPLSSIVKPVK